MVDLPKISIITPTLNSETYLDAAIASVISQDYPEIEHIIIDGGSTDATVTIARSYNHITLIDEPGSGIYGAINRGLQYCHGAVVGLLNSDDVYVSNAILTAISEFNKDELVDAVCGSAETFVMDKDGSKRTMQRYEYPQAGVKIVENMMYGVPVINAWFFRRNVFEVLSGFDTQFRLASDRDFLIRFYLAGIKVRFIKQLFYRYRIHADSYTLNKKASNARMIGHEHMALAEKIRNESNNHEIMKLCKYWHQVSAVTTMTGALKEYKFIETVKLFFTEWSRDVIWPLHMLKIIFCKFANRIQVFWRNEVVKIS